MRIQLAGWIGALMLGVMAPQAALAQQTAGVSLEIERTANTSPEEKLEYTRNALAEIDDIVAAVEKLYTDTQRSGSPKELQCVSSRRTAILTLQQVARSAADAMRDALAAGREELGNHEFRKIAVALTKSRALYSEALRCGSDMVGADGDTFIDVFGDDGGLPDDNPLDLLDGDLPIDTLTTPTLSPFGG